jgi:hypothetical protein
VCPHALQRLWKVRWGRVGHPQVLVQGISLKDLDVEQVGGLVQGDTALGGHLSRGVPFSSLYLMFLCTWTVSTMMVLGGLEPNSSQGQHYSSHGTSVDLPRGPIRPDASLLGNPWGPWGPDASGTQRLHCHCLLCSNSITVACCFTSPGGRDGGWSIRSTVCESVNMSVYSPILYQM